MTCYRKGGCGPYEMLSCGECPASKPEYLNRYGDEKPEPKKPKTHRDMLRSKSDEELAAWFRIVADCEGCPVTENFDECRHGKDCEDKWLEWLIQEAT